jgi:hypothetical protein
MSNKFIFIGITVIILVGLVIFLAFKLLAPSSPAVPQGTDFPSVTGSAQTGGGSTISISTADGSTISVRDPRKDPSTKEDPLNAGQYYMGYHQPEGVSDPTATENPPYVINYIAATQFFNIAILQEPIGQSRKQMETYLMQHLGITQDQMCRLKYMVGVPARINQLYAGQDLRFSFCAGATELP